MIMNIQCMIESGIREIGGFSDRDIFDELDTRERKINDNINTIITGSNYRDSRKKAYELAGGLA